MCFVLAPGCSAREMCLHWRKTRNIAFYYLRIKGLSLKFEFIFNYKDFLWGNITLDKKTNYGPRRSSDDYSVLCSTSFEVLADDRHIIILNFPLLKNWAMLNNTVRFKSVTIKKIDRISQEIRMRWLTKEKIFNKYARRNKSIQLSDESSVIN